MASQPPYRTQQQQQTQQQTRSAPPPQQSETAQTPEFQTTVLPGVKPQAGKTLGPKLEQAVVAAGRAGERNIEIEMIPVPMQSFDSAYFVAKTAAGHALELTMEQKNYKRKYTGIGTIKTQLIPEAPIGTKGKAIVLDTTTGETNERPWTWHQVGGSGLGLWAMIKKLFVKTES
jgi:hypothetical protein